MRSTGTGISFNTGRVVAAVVVLSAGFLLDQFGGDYARVGFWSGMIYVVGHARRSGSCREDRRASWRTDVERVGVIGLGLMGGALAERFLAGGLRVVGFDLREECRQRLAELGGEPVASAREVFAATPRGRAEPAEQRRGRGGARRSRRRCCRARR